MTLSLAAQIEGLLFWQAEPQKVETLSQNLGVTETEISAALTELEQSLTMRGPATAGRGLRLITKNDEYTLGTAPELGELLARLAKEELKTDLGHAGLETLTVVLYRGPVAKSEIDYIRGVNSSHTLRHLLVRGLIVKKPNPTDARSMLYEPTFDLLSLLGLTRLDELPEFETMKKQIDNFLHADTPQTN